MADNIGEYENPQNPIDSGEVNNQTNPTGSQNDDTQHGWTNPTGGNMDPHYNGDTEPVDGGDVTVVTHFWEKVVGKIDRLISIIHPPIQKTWFGRNNWGDPNGIHWNDGSFTELDGWSYFGERDGCIMIMLEGYTYLYVWEDENGGHHISHNPKPGTWGT